MEKVEKKGLKLEYKWVIMIVSFLMVFTGLGFCSGTKSLFLKSITVALDIPRSKFSISDSCRYITTAVLNLFFGVLVAKLGAKKLIACGFASLIAFCMIYSSANDVRWFYLGGVFLGMGLSWCTTTMVGYVVAKWFKENRGTIMGIILAANGIGAAVATQIVSPMIHDATVAGGFGYRNAYRVMAVILLVVTVFVMIFFKESPKGCVETGKPTAAKKKPKRAATWEGVDYKQATKKPYFYLAAVCVFLTGACLQAVSGVSSAHLEDVGMDVSFIATAVSLHSLVMASAKLLAGFSFDKFGLRVTLLICHSIAAVSIFMLAMVSATSYGLATAYEVLISFAMPLETVMLPLIAADMFGERSYAKMMGLMVSINTAGYALGAPVTNWICDMTGTYKNVLIVLAAIMAVVLVMFQLILNQAGKDRAVVMAELEAKKAAKKAEQEAALQAEPAK